MAKTNPTPSGKSRVRIFYVDADLAPGEVRDIAAAFVNAIRPAQQLISGARDRQRVVAGSGVEVSGDSQIDDADVEEFEDGGGECTEVEAPAQKGPSKPRKYRSPKVINDLDMNAGGEPFEEFAREKGDPEDHMKRYLVAAAWLAKYAGIATATVDHVFTCYLSADWTFDIQDPGLPFRRLKPKFGETKGGKFTINHIGHATVEKMKSGAEH